MLMFGKGFVSGNDCKWHVQDHYEFEWKLYK
jgi:hypothetical protein